MLIVWVVPCCVQVTPSGERKAVKTLPLRTSLTQYGAAFPATTASEVPPPVELRHWNETPLTGVTNMLDSLLLAAKVSRIMTPALVQLFVFCSLTTRATIWPSPVMG